MVSSTAYMGAWDDAQFYIFILGCFTLPDAPEGFFVRPHQFDFARIRLIVVSRNYPVE
jgi:hypothetical protein